MPAAINATPISPGSTEENGLLVLSLGTVSPGRSGLLEFRLRTDASAPAGQLVRVSADATAAANSVVRLTRASVGSVFAD